MDFLRWDALFLAEVLEALDAREWDVLEAFFEWARDERTDWDLMRLRRVWSRSPPVPLLPVLAEAAGLAQNAQSHLIIGDKDCIHAREGFQQLDERPLPAFG